MTVWWLYSETGGTGKNAGKTGIFLFPKKNFLFLQRTVEAYKTAGGAE